ncbi:MAG: 3-isopropylmalate dehydratase small subunit [Candidatus Omnitrophica bacterium]|nr:3-isopropylmalate dehydratase small subunit [Candidatus Omnitrophota bacterium]
MKGKAHKFGDNINTDYIISGRYKFSITDPKELAKHIFEDIVPNFSQKVKEGDFIVAGKNFGCGSSREQAPLAIKASGIKAVIAQSFARIFYRNAINLGLMLIEADTSRIKEDDELEIFLEKNKIKNISQNIEIDIKPLPALMQEILNSGGAIEYFKKHGL